MARPDQTSRGGFGQRGLVQRAQWVLRSGGPTAARMGDPDQRPRMLSVCAEKRCRPDGAGATMGSLCDSAHAKVPLHCPIRARGRAPSPLRPGAALAALTGRPGPHPAA